MLSKMETFSWSYICMIISPALFLGKEFHRSGLGLIRYSNLIKMLPLIFGGIIFSKFIDMTSTTNYFCIQVILWVFDIARQTIFYRHKYSPYFKAVEIFLLMLSFISFIQVVAFSGEPRYQTQMRKKVNSYTHPHVPGNFRRSDKAPRNDL